MDSKINILPIEPIGINGISQREYECQKYNVFGYLNNINTNTDLLNENDPLKDEYKKFLNDINNFSNKRY